MAERQESVARLRYGWQHRGADAILGWASRLGLAGGQLDPEAILRSARRSTGLEDWGGDHFLPHLRRLLEVARARPLSAVGRLACEQVVLKAVQNRLRLQAYRRAHPEIDELPVTRPLFVVGLPRTGTTLVQNLLSCGPRRRGLQFWEILSPAPQHPRRSVDLRRRSLAARAALWSAYFMAPEQGVMHAITWDSVEECWPLMCNTFGVLNHDLVQGFRDWGDYVLSEVDMVRAYGEYREQLQVLLHQRPAEQLVLKCPEHLWFLDELLTVFPDAGVVWTHRPPLQALSSYCSLASLSQRTLYGEVDPKALGRHLQDRFQQGLARAEAARAKHPPERFFDLPLDQLARDPVSAIEEALDHFGCPLQPQERQAQQDWLRRPRRDAPGQHRYRAETWGLQAWIPAVPSQTAADQEGP